MNWYVALTKPNAVVEKEQKPRAYETDDDFRARIASLPPQTVMERMEALGMEVFYPKVRIVRRALLNRTRGHGLETVWMPVFGRYMFVKGSPAVIAGVRGVSQVVNNADDVPGIIGEDIIEDIRKRFHNYTVEQRVRDMKLKRGQKVRIMEGPMRGWDATVEIVDLARGLLTAVREAMGREIPIQNLRMEDVEVT